MAQPEPPKYRTPPQPGTAEKKAELSQVARALTRAAGQLDKTLLGVLNEVFHLRESIDRLNETLEKKQ